jgi:asparagine synthase (glutamine-hydrolysing)
MPGRYPAYEARAPDRPVDMCGIAGLITRRPNALERARRAEATQGHRGPDARSQARLQVDSWTLALSHQRLSIIDLSDAGVQPMSRHDNWIVYNGEVYNYLEIRTELEALGEAFKSDTDSEVVLAALNRWGVEEALRRFNGMFSLAWFDAKARKLFLCRDRVGIKPLGIFCDGDELIFASEQKTVLEIAARKFTPNYQVLGEYLYQSLTDSSPMSFFSEIHNVPPGHYGIVDLSKETLAIEWVRYWSPPFDIDDTIDMDRLIPEVRDLFLDSVRLRLRSDVPVGVLLSGGVDSSAISAAMQQILGKHSELNLLSAVSDLPQFDESSFIDRMSSHLGREVHKVRLDFSPERALELMKQVTWHNDQPLNGFSSVAHYLLLQKARDLGITVVLSGQGADELLCGYKKYYMFHLQQLMRTGRYLRCAGAITGSVHQRTILSQVNFREAKRYLPRFLEREEHALGGTAVRDFVRPELGLARGMTIQERQALDVTRFSVPALLHYEDRMSMASSREIRVPYLDHRMIEKLIPQPIETKIRSGWTKHVFRKAMEPLLPTQIAWRRDKMGFNNPEGEWLKDRLRPTVLEYFGEDSLMFRWNIVNRKALLGRYDAYCRQPVNGGRISHKEIFNPLAIEIWLRKFEAHLA